MINYMIQFANNFEADCRDGFVSNDHSYTEHAIEGVDLDKKLRIWCEDNSFPIQEDYPFVDMLVDYARGVQTDRIIIDKFATDEGIAMTYIIIYAKV